ncbi:hypothetical protein EJ08DRAFT_699876 [Tothia fuscella]|uniref:Uncharacterized protein n=1 Tax=Tothia fuscella TaxID=1048955 RepID=A0A9P4TWG8_9PEZI|nr:hypothetical protein EJ08DRAFT_699876 [Tothia fuscella]
MVTLRVHTLLTIILSLTASTTFAAPAPLFQNHVDALRAKGLSEREILTHLRNTHPTPAYTGSLENEYYNPTPNRDTEGDIAPGSSTANAAQIHIGGTTFVDRMSDLVDEVTRGSGEERAARLEVREWRRPVWKFRWMR